MHTLRYITGLALLLAGMFALAACGGDDDDANGDTEPTPTTENGDNREETPTPEDGDDPTATPTESDDNGDLTEVTLMLDWTPNTNHLGFYVAQDRGWYEENGLDVEIVEPGAGGVPQVVAQGSAEFGISVQEGVIPARAQDVGVVAIAAIIQHNTSSLMSLAEDGIERPRDMEGKSYGGFGGPLETAIIETLVECDGGDRSQVTFTDVGNVDYLVGMGRDQYDFVWIFDGWDGIRAEELEGADVNFVRFRDYFECIPDWYTPMVITNEDLIEDDPETVEAFMEATARGYEYTMENPGEAGGRSHRGGAGAGPGAGAAERRLAGGALRGRRAPVGPAGPGHLGALRGVPARCRADGRADRYRRGIHKRVPAVRIGGWNR
ncbi:MAG: ABC transporter substrate-binding protein [Dehalococcoidia bacterium]|nr:ABC transporter substrate-binding protein [Dehalococcoidia bacterium]